MSVKEKIEEFKLKLEKSKNPKKVQLFDRLQNIKSDYYKIEEKVERGETPSSEEMELLDKKMEVFQSQVERGEGRLFGRYRDYYEDEDDFLTLTNVTYDEFCEDCENYEAGILIYNLFGQENCMMGKVVDSCKKDNDLNKAQEEIQKYKNVKMRYFKDYNEYVDYAFKSVRETRKKRPYIMPHNDFHFSVNNGVITKALSIAMIPFNPVAGAVMVANEYHKDKVKEQENEQNQPGLE